MKRFEMFIYSILVLGIVAYTVIAFTSQGRDEGRSGSFLAQDIPEAVPSATRWMADTRLTFDPGASLLSYNFAWSVAADGSGRVHVVWYDKRDGAPQIYYRRSADGGRTWGAEMRLSDDSAASEHPAIAIAGSNVYVVWHSPRNGGQNIYFKRSTDGGMTWGQDTRLTSSGKSAHSSIAASESSVHVVWGDHRDGEQAEIYTRASADAGATWGSETRLSDVPYDSWVSTVAVSGRNVYVAWVDTSDGNEEEYLRRSTDGGINWEPIIRITNNPANSWAPSVAVSGDAVHLVWFDQQDSPIQPLEAERMLDEVMLMLGLTVEPAPTGVMVIHPEEAAKRRAMEKGRQVQAAAPGWVQGGGDAAKLAAILQEFEELGKRGASYFAKERRLDEAMRLMGLTYTPGPQGDLPKVYYLDAMRLRVQDKMEQIQSAGPAWVQRGGDPRDLESRLREFEGAMGLATSQWDIYYKRSADGGATWGPIIRLTNAPRPSQRPSIAVSGNDLHVVWFDHRDGNAEIYYKYSPDAGANWGPDIRLTGAPGDSAHPTVAASGDSVHVVWFDQRDGNSEIYYKRTGKRGWRAADILE